MEQKEESMKQASIQFRSRKITDHCAAKQNLGDQDSRIESPTPDKPESLRRIKGFGSSLMRGRQLFGSERIDLEATDNVGSLKVSNSGAVTTGCDDSIELPAE